jgi:hypothetical protein
MQLTQKKNDSRTKTLLFNSYIVDKFKRRVVKIIVLGCPGLCPNRLSTCLLVNGPLEGLGVLWCGKWHIFASFGAFGEK